MVDRPPPPSSICPTGWLPISPAISISPTWGTTAFGASTPDGIISTYAGGGAASASDEGQPAISTALRTPRNVLADAAGNLYLSEFDGHRVRKVTPDGRIATVAGVWRGRICRR